MLVGPELDLDDPAVALTPRTSEQLLLAPNALLPDSAYTFVLQVRLKTLNPLFCCSRSRRTTTLRMPRS